MVRLSSTSGFKRRSNSCYFHSDSTVLSSHLLRIQLHYLLSELVDCLLFDFIRGYHVPHPVSSTA